MKKSNAVARQVSDFIINYSDPEWDDETKVFKMLKKDQDGNTLDVFLADSEEELFKRKEEEIKQYILSQVNKKKKLQVTKKVAYRQDEVINEIIQRKLDGEDAHAIVVDIVSREGITRQSIETYMETAMRLIREKAVQNIENTLSQHVSRYETIYKWFNAHGYIKHAAKALKHKEALLGMGQDVVTSIEINNVFSAQTGADVLQYNIANLTKEQRVRFMELTKKLSK